MSGRDDLSAGLAGHATTAGCRNKLLATGGVSTTAQFNALAEDLQFAMDSANVPFRAQNKLLAKLAPMLKDMNNR